MTSSVWSLMDAGGCASGSPLASSIVGGCPRQMGPRLGIPSGGLRGFIGSGTGVTGLGWCLVRQWIHGLRQLLGACAVLFSFLREGELGS